MPSSDPVSILPVLTMVKELKPASILDVGCGNGRYGFLFREILDWNYGRFLMPEWETIIDGVEIEHSYITNVHRNVYNTVHCSDWLEFKIKSYYDLIFMGDVLEHFNEEDWQKALMKAIDNSKVTIVVSPNWLGSSCQSEWHGNKHERHLVELSPEIVGGKCLFANSKVFISFFENNGISVLNDKKLIGENL